MEMAKAKTSGRGTLPVRKGVRVMVQVPGLGGHQWELRLDPKTGRNHLGHFKEVNETLM